MSYTASTACLAGAADKTCLPTCCNYQSLHEVQDAEAAPTPQATPRGGKKGAEPVTDSLAVGAFSLQPATAALAAGAKQIVTVAFKAEGAKQSAQQVGIAISDRSVGLSNVPVTVHNCSGRRDAHELYFANAFLFLRSLSQYIM